MAGNLGRWPAGGAQAGKIAILPASTHETAMRKTIVLLLLSLLSLTATAQVNSQPLSAAEREEKLGRARTLKAEAAESQKAADAKQKTANDACYKKFQVSSCLDAARKEHTASTREAKRKDLEAGEIERDVKRREVAVKDAKRAADVPVKASEQKAKGEAYREEEAKKADARSAKAIKKEREAAQGREKHAKEQARRERKAESQIKKDEQVAEKRRKREERQAQQAAKYPEGTKPGSPPVNP